MLPRKYFCVLSPAYGASDFILMPSRFEPCGLPQMIAPIYGSLPVAFDTGGIHDTIIHLDVDNNTGNGFLFKFFDSIVVFRKINFFEGFIKNAPSD